MKQFILPTLLAIAALSIVACNSNQNQEARQTLTHHAVHFDDEFIGQGGFLIALENGVFGMEESSSMPAFYRAKKHGDHYDLSRFINRGQGPNELLYPFNIQYIDDHTIGTYDIANMSYYTVSMTDNADSAKLQKQAHFDDRFYRVIKMAGNRYLALSGKDGLFTLLDGERTVASFFEYPYKDSSEKDIKNSIRSLAYQGTLTANPSATKCVYAPFNGDIIHFYDIKEDRAVLINKHEKVYPDYEVHEADGRVVTKGSTMSGFLSVAATDSFVYALFCGKNINHSVENNEDMEGQILRVYDWKGNKVREVNMSVPCRHIGVSLDDQTLWAVATSPEISLVRFSLNEESDTSVSQQKIAEQKPSQETSGNQETKPSSPEIVRIELENIQPSKEEIAPVVCENLPAIKSIQTTSKDITVDVQHKDNDTVLYCKVTKATFGSFSDTVTVQLENGKSMKLNLYKK